MLGFRKAFGNLSRGLALQSRARRMRICGPNHWPKAIIHRSLGRSPREQNPGAMTSPCKRCFLWPACVLLLFAHAGCLSNPPPPAAAPAEKPAAPAPPGAAQTEIDRGLIRVAVEVRPHPARLSDEPTLTLTIDSARGVVVEKPPFGEAIGGFVIRDFREPLPETQGDREIRRQVYTLEPVQTGTQHIDPITVAFIDRRPQGDGKRHTVETESLAVEVTSMLKADVPSLDQLKPMTGPVELPPAAAGGRAWRLGGLLAAVLGAGGCWWLWRRRRKDLPETTLSPQELAYLELEALLQENVSATDVKLFYVRLTGIVRRFIERTTGVHAPEQTTEEFLREIGKGHLFLGDEQTRLKSFLESADLVKFAAREPTDDDVEQTFRRAQAFLGLQAQEAAA